MGSTPAISAAELEEEARIGEERTIAIFTVFVHAAAISMMSAIVTTPEFPTPVVQRKDDDATIAALRTVTDPQRSVIGESLTNADIAALQVYIYI
jgi:hypothetical protein